MSVLLSYFSAILYYLLVLFAITIFCVYLYFKSIYRYWRKRGVEYIEPKLIFGNIIKCFDGSTHASDVIKNIYFKIKGPFAGGYFLHKPVIFIKDPELLKHILVKDFNNFADRGVHSDGESDPLSLHLFRLSGEKWRALRNKLTPAFTSGKLKLMFPIILKIGQQLENNLEELNSQIVDIKDMCSRYTIDVISSVAFGIETNSFTDSKNEMYVFISKLMKPGKSYMHGVKQNLALCCPEVLTLLRQATHSEIAINFMFDVVKRVIDHRFTNDFKRNDFMQVLIQLRSEGQLKTDDKKIRDFYNDIKNPSSTLSFDELVAQAFVFIVAGFETSASTMSYCLYELAKNPEIQKQVQKNIDEILLKYNGEICYESISEMEYLSMVVNETLRKYPSLGLLNRLSKDNYTIPNSNIQIEKNTNVLISVTGLHYDPNLYPNPDKFDPERFSPQNKEKIIPYTYLPFGEGPRHCIGMRLAKIQTAVGLAMSLQKHNFEVCKDTPEKITFICGQIISLNKENIKLRISNRY